MGRDFHFRRMWSEKNVTPHCNCFRRTGRDFNFRRMWSEKNVQNSYGNLALAEVNKVRELRFRRIYCCEVINIKLFQRTSRYHYLYYIYLLLLYLLLYHKLYDKYFIKSELLVIHIYMYFQSRIYVLVCQNKCFIHK